jgi:hypothetical protein
MRKPLITIAASQGARDAAQAMRGTRARALGQIPAYADAFRAGLSGWNAGLQRNVPDSAVRQAEGSADHTAGPERQSA